jgi:hypothetical protein
VTLTAAGALVGGGSLETYDVPLTLSGLSLSGAISSMGSASLTFSNLVMLSGAASIFTQGAPVLFQASQLQGLVQTFVPSVAQFLGTTAVCHPLSSDSFVCAA